VNSKLLLPLAFKQRDFYAENAVNARKYVYCGVRKGRKREGEPEKGSEE